MRFFSDVLALIAHNIFVERRKVSSVFLFEGLSVMAQARKHLCAVEGKIYNSAAESFLAFNIRKAYRLFVSFVHFFQFQSVQALIENTSEDTGIGFTIF